jgi:hypothetical protein
MELTCARAVDLGFPAVAFTEHVDYATRAATASDLDERLQGLIWHAVSPKRPTWWRPTASDPDSIPTTSGRAQAEATVIEYGPSP